MSLQGHSYYQLQVLPTRTMHPPSLPVLQERFRLRPVVRRRPAVVCRPERSPV